MFKCPYCQQDSYAKGGKKNGKFESWKSIHSHVIHCSKNNKEYYISPEYGPIHYSEFINQKLKHNKEIKLKYPNIGPFLTAIRNRFKIKNIEVTYANPKLSKEFILKAIQTFYKEHNRIPQMREFINTEKEYPSPKSVQRYFSSWNQAIIESGFEPDINNGFGERTVANDGVLYRSKAEAYFVDTFLYNICI